MMYSQGLKRVIAARGVVQLLLGSSTRAVTVGLVNHNVQAFSVYNVETVSTAYLMERTIINNHDIERFLIQEEEGQEDQPR